MNEFALIAAGGTGSRMNSSTPKQFMLFAGKPLLMHSIYKFAQYSSDIEIIVIIPLEYFNMWNKLCTVYNLNIKHKTTHSGNTRFESVKNGLATITSDKDGVVAIHDAARPLVRTETIRKLFNYARSHNNAVPVASVNDSVRVLQNSKSTPFDRKVLRLVQTPQCFNKLLLEKAYKQKYRPEFTDDATVVESAGEHINLIEGDTFNIKITTPSDFIIAESLFINH